MFVVSDLASKFKTKSYTDKRSDTGGELFHLPPLPLFYFLFVSGALNIFLALISFGHFGDQFNLEFTIHKDYIWSSFYSPQLFTFSTELLSFFFFFSLLYKILNNHVDSSLNKDTQIKEHEIQFSGHKFSYLREFAYLTLLFSSPILIISSVATNNYGFYPNQTYPNTWFNLILVFRVYLYSILIAILSISSLLALLRNAKEKKLLINQKIKTIKHVDIKNNNQTFITVVEEKFEKHHSYNAYIELKNFDYDNKSEKLKLSFASKLDRLIYQNDLVKLEKNQAFLIKVSIPFLRQVKSNDADHQNSNKFYALTQFSKSFEKKLINRVFLKISQNVDTFNSEKETEFGEFLHKTITELNEQLIYATVCNPSLIARIQLYLKRNNLFNGNSKPDSKLEDFFDKTSNERDKEDTIFEKRFIKDFETIDYFYGEYLFNVKFHNEIESIQNHDKIIDKLSKIIPNWDPNRSYNQFKNQKINDLFLDWMNKEELLAKFKESNDKKPIDTLIEYFNKILGSFLLHDFSTKDQEPTYIKVNNSWSRFFSTIKSSIKDEENLKNLKEDSFSSYDSAVSLYKMTDTSILLNSGYLYNMIKESGNDTIIVPFIQKDYSKNDQRKSIINRFSRFLNSKESEFNRNLTREQSNKLVENAFQDIFASGSRLASFSVYVLKKYKNLGEAYKHKKQINLIYKPSAFSVGIRVERTDDEQYIHLAHILKHHDWDYEDFEPYYNDRFVCSYNTLSSLGFFTVQNEIDDISNSSIYFGSNFEDKDDNDIWVNMGRYRDKKVANVPSSNGHTVIIGKSGSGKTYLAQSLVFQKSKNMRVFIFDIENEYQDVFKLLALKSYPHLSTQSIDLMENSSNINPFDIQLSSDEKIKIDHYFETSSIDDNNGAKIFNETLGKQKSSYIMIYQRHKTFLLRFLKTLFKYEENDFDVEWLTLIEEVYLKKLSIINSVMGNKKDLLKDDSLIKGLINSPVHSPTMTTLFEVIKQKAADYNITDYSSSQKSAPSVDYRVNLYSFYYNLQEKVKELDKDKFFMSKFSTPTSITLDKDYIRFDVSSLLTSSSLNHYSQLSLMLILNYLTITIFMKDITNTSSDNPSLENKGIFVLIDETHRYLRKELVDMVDFMTALAKQGRKRYAEMCIISQNISDFYRQSDSKDIVQKAQDVVKNCGYKFIMQLAQDYDLVKDFISSSFDITEKDDNFVRSLSKGIGYLVQGPLEQMGVKVKRLETHNQYENVHKELSSVFNQSSLHKFDDFKKKIKNYFKDIYEANLESQEIQNHSLESASEEIFEDYFKNILVTYSKNNSTKR